MMTRLLREMESTAKAEVYKSIVLPSNELKGVVHLMRDELSCSTKVAIVFELNNKKHRVDINLNDFVNQTVHSRATHIVKELSEYLATNILNTVFDSKQIREVLN